MASNLSEFLGLNDISEVKETIRIRIGGKDLELVVRPLTNDEHGEFQRRSMNTVKGKTNFDIYKYNNLILEACIVEPNFKDAEFLKKANCISANDFINKKFPAGVIMEISSQIQKLSGFESLEAEVEEAKN